MWIDERFGAESAPTVRALAPGINGIYNSGTGVLTLRGSATVADYQEALRSVTYENSSDDPDPLRRTVSIRLMGRTEDGDQVSSNVARRGITITAVNDAPQIKTTEGETASIWNEPNYVGVIVDAGVRAKDADDSNLEGATVRISSGFEMDDQLVFMDQLGITGTYDSGTGILTLTGSASVGDYEAALRSVRYDHEGNTKPSPSKTIEFKTNDGGLDSAADTKNITIS